MLHHTGEKPFLRTRICKSCYKQFMSKLVLKSHKLGHTGEKPILELEIVTFVTTAHAKMCLEEPYTWSHWRETVPKLNDPGNRAFRPHMIWKALNTLSHLSQIKHKIWCLEVFAPSMASMCVFNITVH